MEEQEKRATKIKVGCRNRKIYEMNYNKYGCWLVVGDKTSCRTNLITNIINEINNAPNEENKIIIIGSNDYLNTFKDYKNLLLPIIYNDTQKAFDALEWCIEERFRRYEKFASFKVVNINQFNKIVEGKNLKPFANIFLIIDDYEILLQANQDLFNEYVFKLSLGSRAAGIYTIFSTQSHCFDKRSKELLNNIPTRIVLKTKDSRISKLLTGTVKASDLKRDEDFLVFIENLKQLDRFRLINKTHF